MQGGELRERLRNPKIPENACLEQRLKTGTNKQTNKNRKYHVGFLLLKEKEIRFDLEHHIAMTL